MSANIDKKSTTQPDRASPAEKADVEQGRTEGHETEYPHGLKLALILIAMCSAVFLVALDQTIIATAIPKITDEFSSIKDIGWYGSSYLLTATALQPTFGRIYTIFSVSSQTVEVNSKPNWRGRSKVHFLQQSPYLSWDP
jgi:hypothetical protein